MATNPSPVAAAATSDSRLAEAQAAIRAAVLTRKATLGQIQKIAQQYDLTLPSPETVQAALDWSKKKGNDPNRIEIPLVSPPTVQAAPVAETAVSVLPPATPMEQSLIGAQIAPAQGGVENFLWNKVYDVATGLGADKETGQYFANRLIGPGDEFGLIDISPGAAPIDIQEGYRKASTGLATDQYGAAGLGALQLAFGLAEAVPVLGYGVKALKTGVSALPPLTPAQALIRAEPLPLPPQQTALRQLAARPVAEAPAPAVRAPAAPAIVPDIQRPTIELPAAPRPVAAAPAVELPPAPRAAAPVAELPPVQRVIATPTTELPPVRMPNAAERAESIGVLEQKGLTQPVAQHGVTRKVADFAADYLNTAKVARPEGAPFMDFFRQHFQAGTLPPEELQSLYSKHGITDEVDWVELVTGVRASASELGRGLAYIKHSSDKVPREAAELAARMAKEAPNPSLWRRSGNAARGLFVATMAKTTRDWAGAAIRVPIDTFTALADNAINATLNPVRRAAGKEAVPVDFGDSFVLMTQMLGKGRREQGREIMRQLRNANPKLNRDLMDAYASSEFVRPGSIGDKFSKVEKGIDVLNFLNRASDSAMRKTLFPAFLRRAAARKGIDFDAVVAAQGLHTLPDDVLEKAFQDTLDYTYSRNPGKGGGVFMGEGMEKVVDVINGTGPIGAAVIGFPRFIANALQFQLDHSPIGLARAFTPKGMKRIMAGDTEVLSKGLAGSTLLYAAMEFQDSEYAGSKWYLAKLPNGQEVDLRPFFPLAPYLLVADIIKRFNDGTIDVAYTTADILQGLSGAQFRAGSSLYMVDQLIRDLKEAGSAGEKSMGAIKNILGSFVGSLTNPANLIPFKDIAATFVPEEGVTRDTSEAPFLGQALRNIPFAQSELLGLPEQQYASQEGPRVSENPMMRPLLGASITQPATVVQKEMRRLGFDESDLYTKEGSPALDRRAKEVFGAIAEQNVQNLVSRPEYQAADNVGKAVLFKDFMREVRAASRDIVKQEDPTFAAVIWYNDKSREEKIQIDRQFRDQYGMDFRKFYGQLSEAPLVNSQEEYDALPVGTKFTDPGDFKVHTKE